MKIIIKKLKTEKINNNKKVAEILSTQLYKINIKIFFVQI